MKKNKNNFQIRAARVETWQRGDAAWVERICGDKINLFMACYRQNAGNEVMS